MQTTTDTVNFLKASKQALVHPNLGVPLHTKNPTNKPEQKTERVTIEGVLGSSEKKIRRVYLSKTSNTRKPGISKSK